MTESEFDKSSPEWWLDEAALPELVWAAILASQDGWTVLDCDGALHIFDDRRSAEEWLHQEDYVQRENLISDGVLSKDAQPPNLSPINTPDGEP